MITGLLGLLVFCADIWAIITILNSKATVGTKIMWCILVMVLPLIGLIIWFVAGPRT